MNLEKMYEKINKKWIGRLYGYSIFFILSSFGGILEFAFNLIYLWLWLVIIGYTITLPIGFIKEHHKKLERMNKKLEED
ncbi:unnamed protein product [marine sediment metagenome]|uniref:2TM domain-containing protein n=1 Tax=marine sediment metagenome TaxID=412755 RepID=X1BVT6_9ZZZZ